jgi:hypothetical protein
MHMLEMQLPDIYVIFTVMPLIQVVAGLRCRKNKTAVLLGMLTGRRWLPDELFTSEAGARPEANAILSNMTTFLQRSSNIANR